MNKICFWTLLLASFVCNVTCRPQPWERVQRDTGDEVTEEGVTEGSHESSHEPRDVNDPKSSYEPLPINDSMWNKVITELSRLSRIFSVLQNAETRLKAFWEQVHEDVHVEMDRFTGTHKSEEHESETHRIKRHVSQGLPLIRDHEGYWSPQQWSTSWTAVIRNNWKDNYATLSMTPFMHKDLIFWISTSIYHEDDPGVTGIYMMTMFGGEAKVQYSKIMGTHGANKCIPILKNDHFIEIVCAESFEGDTSSQATQRGSSVLRVSWTSGKLEANVIRHLATRNAVDVTTFSHGNNIYIAFASSYDMIRGSYETYSTVTKVTTGEYNGTPYTSYEYVDSTRMITSGASAVTSFSIRSQKFIAVANHHNDLGKTDIFSEIFTFDDIESHRIISFQKILTKAARGIAYFRFQSGYQQEHFIAVANEYKEIDGVKVYETESLIYKFVDGKFIPFQCIPTNGAWQIISYQGENGELLLAVVNSRIENGVHLYQYDGWRFVRLYDIYIKTKIGVNHVSITKVKEEIWLTVCDPEDDDNWKPQIYSFIFVHKNPLADYHNHCHEWCLSRKYTLSTWDLTALKIIIEGLPKRLEPQTFHSNMTFAKNLYVDTPEHSVVHSTIYEDGSGKIWGTRVGDAVQGRKAECDEFSATLLSLQTKYNSTMKVDSVNLDLVTFSTVSVSTEIEAVTVFTNYYNEYEVNWDLYINFVNMVDVDVQLTSVVIEESNNYIYTIVFLDGQSIQTDDFVYLNQDVTITADTTFNSLITLSMTVTTLNTANFLLLTGSKYITGYYTFVTFWIDGITVTNYINGVDFNNFVNILVINDGRSIVIDGDVTVKVNVKADYFITYTLSQHILVNIVNNVFRTNVALQQFTGDFTCGWMITSNIWIEVTLNEVIVPDGCYLQNSVYDLSDVQVTFLSVTSSKITILESLSEIQVLENLMLDILHISYSESVTGVKIFNKMFLGGTSVVNGTVANIMIQDLVVESIVINDIIGNRIEGSVRFEGGLTVTTGMVGEVNINRIIKYAMPLSKDAFAAYCLATGTSCTQFVINQQFIFNQQVQVTGDFQCGLLNEINIADYCTLKGDHTITTELTFYGNMVSQTNIEVLLVNGQDLSLLLSSLWLQSSGGTLLYDITFNYLNIQNIVSTTCTFGTIDITDLVLLHEDVTISSDWTFTTTIWKSSVSIHSVIMTHIGTLDAVLFTDLLLPCLKKSSTTVQVLTGTNIKVKRFVCNTLTGLGLNVLAEKVIYVDQDLHFNHNIRIESQVYIENLFFISFDGVSSEDYAFGWLLNDGSCQNLTGHNIFAGDLTVENLEIPEADFTFLNLTRTEIELSVTSLVNVLGALRDTARVNRDVSMGSSMVWGEMESDSNIDVSHWTQGIDLSEQSICTCDMDGLIMSGKKTFEMPVHFTEEFWIDEYLIINDASIFHEGVCEDFIHPLNLKSLDIYGDVILHNFATIYDEFNEYNTTNIINIYWQVDRNVTINTEVVINAGFFGTINLEGIILNGLVQAEIEALLARRIKVNSEISQTITGLFTFNDMTVDYLYVFDLTTSNQIINLINIFRRDLNQEITGNWNVKIINSINAVNMNFWLFGTLNGISLVNLLRINHWSLITAQKYFNFDVTVNTNLNVEVKYEVQDVDISVWAEKSMFIDQDYDLDYGIICETTTHIHNQLIVTGLVNGVVMASSFLFTKSGTQTLFMETLYVTNVEMKNTVRTDDGEFLGVNLSRIESQAVFMEQDVIITEATSFSEELTLGDIVLGMFNGINITMLGDFLTATYEKMITTSITTLYNKCNSITTTIEESAVMFWYWKTTNEFKSGGEDIFLYPVCFQHDSYHFTGNRFMNPSILMLQGFNMLKLLDWNVQSNNYEVSFEYNFKSISGAAGLGKNFLGLCSYRKPSTSLKNQFTIGKYINTSVILDENTGPNESKFGHIYHIADGVPRIVTSYPVHGCVDIFAFNINKRKCMAPLNFRSNICTIICYNEAYQTFVHFATLQVKQAFQATWISNSRFTFIFIGTMAILDNGISTINIFKLKENGENELQHKIQMKVAQFEFSLLELESYSHDLLIVLVKSSRVANAYIRICHINYDMDDGDNLSVVELKDLHHELISSATRLSLTVTSDLRPLIVVECTNLIVFFQGTPMGTDFTFHSKIHIGVGRTTNMVAFIDETRRNIHVTSSFIGTAKYDYYSFLDDQTVSSSFIYTSVHRPDLIVEEADNQLLQRG